MPDAGRLDLRILWDGAAVCGIDVQSTRAQASRILDGRKPEDAVQFVPMLFSVCAKAQRAASVSAVAAALGREPAQAADIERGVVCEVMQEHLWRLLLDWPLLLGLPQEKAHFVRWHGELNAIAAGRGNAQNLLEDVRATLLGLSEAGWLGLDSFAALEAWCSAGRGLLAPVVSGLARHEREEAFRVPPSSCGLLPDWDAEEAMRLFAGRLDRDFAASPQYAGRPMETGALSVRQDTPLVRDTLARHPSRLLARVAARLADLLGCAEALAQGTVAGRVGHAGGGGLGLAVAKTARGMLMHQVRIEAGRVAQYLIVAPTEWNFHPGGALADGLAGMREKDMERLMYKARLQVLSLDPCVECAIGVVRHA